MLKLVINNIEERPVPIVYLRYQSIFEISQIQQHADTAYFQLPATSLNILQQFENVEVTNIKLFNNQNELLIDLSFNNTTYLTKFLIRTIDDVALVEAFFGPMDSK